MKSRLKGLYIISEIECLDSVTGAFHHIQNGLKELDKYYDIDIFILTTKKRINGDIPGKNIGVSKSIDFPFKNIIKWIYLLLSRNLDVFSWYFKVKSQRPDFIYERASSLNFKGIIISKMLRIPHFYEINGVFYLERRKDYPAVLNRIAKGLETAAYNQSTHVFFIGGIRQCYQLCRKNYTDVQNGIERSFAEQFAGKPGGVDDGKINVAFIGHAMKHHRLDMLVAGFKDVNNPSRFHIHFAGSNYEKFGLDFQSSLPVTFHGKLSHKEIASLLLSCQVGILPFAEQFASPVKLFMYGAARMLLLIPDVKNLTEIFNENEVMFFTNENSEDLVRALNEIDGNPAIIKILGDKVYRKVMEQFLWDKIFKKQAEIMNAYIFSKS